MIRASPKIAGLCGILAPIIALVFISISIFLHPWFSWTENALSDLGALGTSYNFVFNLGLIITGITFLLFVTGLPELLNRAISRVGVWILALSALSLTAIGIFPSGTSPHGNATIGFYSFAAIALLLIGGDLTLEHNNRGWGVITLLLVLTGLLAALAFPWSSAAIPETIGALVLSVWGILFGARLLYRALSYG